MVLSASFCMQRIASTHYSRTERYLKNTTKMKHLTFGFIKCFFLVASLGLVVQVAGDVKHYGEVYNAVINETGASHLGNITDFNVTNPHNNAFGFEDRICTEKQIRHDGKCVDCDCGNGTCRLDFWGITKTCLCSRHQTLHEGKCVDCGCGKESSGCYFDRVGNKKCGCFRGSAQFEGTCQVCDCGENSLDCSFNEAGEINCHCMNEFFQKNNTCHEIGPCNLTCENNGTCKRENDTWKCECVGPFAGEYCEKDCDCGLAVCELDEYGYKKECNCTDHQALFEGKCLECDCGDAECELDKNGLKRECNCTEKQIMYEGKCVDCDCGNGTCRLDYRGKKTCSCRKDQALHKGKCIDCDCGERSVGCFFDTLDNKWCVCLQGSAPFEGACQNCGCGERTSGCDFNKNGTVNCKCMQGYTQRNNTCHENCKRSSDCLNGGACRTEKDGRFCKCRRGFSGARCRVDDLCDKLKDKCGDMGAVCKRDGDVRFCECPQGKTYRWKSGLCENICDGKKCNFGTCVVVGKDYTCRCKQGFTGLHCDEIDNSYDIKFRVIVLVLLCVAIASFFIATFCLIRRNTKLIRSLQQKNSIQ